MAISSDTRRWTALIGLWAVVVVVAWVVMVQLFLVLTSPFGSWQWPGIAYVQVQRVEVDTESRLTDHVFVTHGDQSRTLTMLKAECSDLKDGDEIWVLDNYYVKGPRPDHFRFSLLRLLLEYPEPLALLALLGIWRVRKAQAKALAEPPSKPPTVWRDEFHHRAFRQEAPKDSQGE